jgi:ribosome-associated toxin RatA of RatAB toxin-antitoxin module
MKKLHGAATVRVEATTEECFSLLAAVDRYPRWYPEVVRAAKVLAAREDGYPTRVEVTLHVSRRPIERDFDLIMEVHVAQPRSVLLTRIVSGSSDEEEFRVAWEIEEHADGRQIGLEVDACLSVPGFLPLGNIGDDLAVGFVTAVARALATAP